MNFKLTTKYQPAGDQPNAISELEKGAKDYDLASCTMDHAAKVIRAIQDERMTMRAALARCEAWINAWREDKQFGLRPTDTSLNDALGWIALATKAEGEKEAA